MCICVVMKETVDGINLRAGFLGLLYDTFCYLLIILYIYYCVPNKYNSKIMEDAVMCFILRELRMQRFYLTLLRKTNFLVQVVQKVTELSWRS